MQMVEEEGNSMCKGSFWPTEGTVRRFIWLKMRMCVL